MDIIINREKLNKAIRTAERIVSKNISLPILNTILLKASNNSLKITTTNLEIGINYKIGAKINKEGEVAVPAKLISGLLYGVNDDKVSLVASNNVLKINIGGCKTHILGMPTKDFPIIPKVKKDDILEVDPVFLRSGLLSVVDSVLLSETRPELSGIFVNIYDNKIEFAATDSFRLSEKIVLLDKPIKTNKQFILPRPTAIELIRILEGIDQLINIAVSDNQILVYSDEFELVSRLIDGRYPEYKKIIPEKISSTLRINKAEFDKNIRAAALFSSSIYDIKIKTEDKKTEITAQNSDKGEISAFINSELKNRPFEVVINYNYLLDGIKNINSENIILHYTGDGSPILLKQEGRNDFVYLIMPLRN